IFVVRTVEHAAHALECRCIAVGQFARRDAFLARALQHLDAMFVRAGQEPDILAVEALETRQSVGRNQLISMSDMRLAVRVSNRGGDIEFFTAHCGPGLSMIENASEGSPDAQIENSSA